MSPPATGLIRRGYVALVAERRLHADEDVAVLDAEDEQDTTGQDEAGQDETPAEDQAEAAPAEDQAEDLAEVADDNSGEEKSDA